MSSAKVSTRFLIIKKKKKNLKFDLFLFLLLLFLFQNFNDKVSSAPPLLQRNWLFNIRKWRRRGLVLSVLFQILLCTCTMQCSGWKEMHLIVCTHVRLVEPYNILCRAEAAQKKKLRVSSSFSFRHRLYSLCRTIQSAQSAVKQKQQQQQQQSVVGSSFSCCTVPSSLISQGEETVRKPS